MSLIQLLTCSFIGLLSGAHCAGRCSGMIGAINSSLRPYSGRRPLWLGLSLGRLAGYAVGGAIAGSLGWSLLQIAAPALYPRQFMDAVAGLMLVLMGVSIAGRPAAVAWTERPGRRLWTWLQPVWRRYLPPNTLTRAFKAGLLWGWLPCGLVYCVAISALASTTPQQGALIMFAFGVGTLPNVLAIAWLSGRWRHHFQNPRIRLLSGVLIMLAGIQHALRSVLSVTAAT